MLTSLFRRARAALTTTLALNDQPALAAEPLTPVLIPSIRFRDLLDSYWRDHWRHLSSASQMDTIIRLYLRPDHTAERPGLGDLRANQITQEVVRRWHSAHREKPRIANRALLCARQMWRELLPDQLNPFERVRPFPERQRTRRFTDDERRRFVAALEELRREGKIEDVVADAILVVRGTFARKGEILKLRREQVDLAAKLALIDDHKTDDFEGSRVIQLDLVLDVIRRRLEVCERTGNPYLFPSSRSKPGHVTAIGGAFHKVCARAGIVRTRDLCVHLLRGDGASMLLDEGIDLRIIQTILGHRDPSTTARYARASQDSAKRATLRVADKLGGLPC